jgi:putative hydrolase of the HAD superfamily
LIKAVLFDLDETLLDRDATVQIYLRGQHRCFHLEHVPFEIYWERFRELDEHGYAEKQKVFQALTAEFDLPASAEELVTDFYRNAWNDCKTFADAVRVLRELRARGYRLGIITNGSIQSQRSKLRASGLNALVDAMLISEEERIRKPDPQIFIRAAERLGVGAQECAFVGDNPRSDVAGARGAGMKTVWVKRHFPWPDDQAIEPDHTVSALTELLDIKF